MTNPADELASIFESWEMQGHSPLQAREREMPENFTSRDFWIGQGRAVALVNDVVTTLSAIESATGKSSPASLYISDWYRAAFSADTPWVQSVQGPAIRSDALIALRMLGENLEMRPVLGLSESGRGELLDGLREAREFIQDSVGDLSLVERKYVFTLIEAADAFVRERHTLGEADLRAHLDALDGALMGVAAHLAAHGSAEAGNALLKITLRIVSAARGVTNDAANVLAIAGLTAPQVIDAVSKTLNQG